jgi:hypothetical protein
MEPEPCKPDIYVLGENVCDNLISAEVMPPVDGILIPAKVTGCKRDAVGQPMGNPNANPVLDTQVYEVTFPDDHTSEYAANIIIKNTFWQVDSEGNTHLYFQEINDHRCDDSKSLDTKSKTTKGWRLQVLWKDGSTSWKHLREMKESNPIEAAEYAVANQIHEEPAFRLWVKHTLKKRNHFTLAVKARCKRKCFKLGIEIPTTFERALQIDQEMGTSLWTKAIEKEMLPVFPAFKILEENEPVPVASKFICCHMHFELKLDPTRKARYMAGGHMTDPPITLTYSSVVARDSVHLAFLMAALNNLEIVTADIGNAYLNAPTKKRSIQFVLLSLVQGLLVELL